MAARRQPVSAVPTPQPKPVITLEEWEAKAPLGELEARSVNLLKTASENAALPVKFSTTESGPSSRPASPSPRNRLLGTPRPGTPGAGASARTAAAGGALHPKHPIATPQQFYDWFALIDRSVTHSQEAHFRAHLAGVAAHLETCDALVQRIDEIDAEVEGMLQGWRSVEEGGKSLKDACEELLEERDRLLEMTEAIGTRLEYFQELEQATRMLNHPGESLVLQTDFLYMVERVDICIDYLKAHRHFKEAEIYLLRFQQCMTRAMTLIKMYFVGSLRALVADVTKRISEKDVSTTAQHHLLYTRFTTVSSQLAPLLAELERRATAHPEELSSLLSECHSAYFAARKGLLVPRLVEEIKGLDPTRTELVELTRAGCSYLKQLCTDEFDLFRQFFNSGEEQLYQYLENLCDYLYDDLRPRILHEPRLTALCEVCTVLQALMVLDVPRLDEGLDEDEDDTLNLDLDRPSGHRGLRTLHISHLLQMVLQDAQTRLFFKAQSVIQSEIRYYVPKPEDLAYPDKLVGGDADAWAADFLAAARKPVSGTEIKEKESFSQLFQLKSLDRQETWYPTLRRTVWVLSQLHEFVKPAIFDDIAQEAVNLCRQSLVNAADTLKSKNPPSSILDGQLFLVRHVLILKEITQNLDFASRDPERVVDFTGVTDTLASILGKTTSLLPNALFASLGMPREESLTDVKHGVDHELKRACEDVIASCADTVCMALRVWLERVSQHNAQPQKQPLAAQAWASEPAVSALVSGFREACLRDLRAAVTRLKLYLEEDRTVAVLVKHVQERIVDEYAEFRRVIWSEYSGPVRSEVSNEEVLRALLQEACGSDIEAAVEAGTSAKP
ncbi:Sec34 domain-containing protein [Phanerochaete sordida]|uniref:Conserved oligomeric Golgi complex subunit 3 n=1 Tax=Phanerochaete sordida TaxID=48140 RepID=A0A9P3GDD6_9APHY|nr:Sec34 domain-containing protein [Phanerochaete sordida]